MAATTLMIPAAMALMILLLDPTGCIALTSSFKPILNNNVTSKSGGGLVGEEDIEREFLMESHMSRFLAESQNFQTSTTNNANNAAVGDCNRPPRYDSCLGSKRSTPPPENCGTYNRANPC